MKIYTNIFICIALIINRLLILILLYESQYNVQMFQISRLISNKSYNIEEYGTVYFDCLLEQHILVAWRINLRHANIYR